jgi:HSP20 family protein
MLVRFDYPKTCDCDSLMNDFLATDRVPVRTEFPALDIIEQENEIVVSAELPGMKKEDVKITFEKNVLTISGERKPVELSEKAKVLLKETQSESFDRSVRLGYEIDSAKISAEMSNGILTITLPKTEEAKPKQIEVKVK